jgi:prepilin-type N-terminal cleavage/methylation domain-containing protein
VSVTDFFLRNRRGLTLIEVLISILIGTLAILGVYQLFSSSLRTYNLQEQLNGMYQNGTFTIKKISEVLMQAGVDLPQHNYPVLSVSSPHPDSFSIKLNPTGAVYLLDTTYTSVSKIPDSIAVPFLACDHIVADSLSIDSVLKEYAVTSVDTLPAPKWDTIRLGTSGTFVQNTTIYGYKALAFYRKGNAICSNTDTLAENIDSFCVVYYNKSHTATTTIWDSMFTANIFVRVRTSQPDPRYKCPGFNDGYRRLPMSTEVRFRNKF